MKIFNLTLNRFDAKKFVRFKMSISVNLSDNGVYEVHFQTEPKQQKDSDSFFVCVMMFVVSVFNDL